VLLDIDLPDASGWAAFARISARYPGVPVILLTRRPHLEETARRAGAAGLVEKPLSVLALVQRLGDLLSMRRVGKGATLVLSAG